MKTNSKHTPGPWAVKGRNKRGQFQIEAVGQYELGTVDWPIGEVRARHVGSEYSRDEANARLIAAAPELLEVLQNALEHIENDKYLKRFIIDEIKTVLGKATRK